METEIGIDSTDRSINEAGTGNGCNGMALAVAGMAGEGVCGGGTWGGNVWAAGTAQAGSVQCVV